MLTANGFVTFDNYFGIREFTIVRYNAFTLCVSI